MSQFDVFRYKPHMLPKVRSKEIMRAPEFGDMPCTLRICSLLPAYRCSSPATVVGCHLPVWGKGTGTKVTDMALAFGCQRCHDILDGRDRQRTEYLITHHPALLAERMLHGLTESHAILIQRGIIRIPGMETV